MATKNFKDYAIAGSNVTLTYDDNNDTVTIAAQGNVQSVNGKTGVVVINKSDVSLGNVDNTSDINKPISTLVQNALNLKEGTITAGTTSQYWRGDKTFQTLDKSAVGLSNVDNTSDLSKPISTATQTALNLKQDTITLTTTGSSGASTFAANVLNIPNYSLSGLGGQPLNANLTSISALTYASTSFVKMTAAGTFALDTATYLTAESDTLASVTGRGNTTTNAITVGGITSSGAIIPSSAGVANLGSSALNWARVFANRFVSAAGLDLNLSSNGIGTNINFQINDASGNVIGKAFSTGNWVFQNGGTFTDAGFRLDVNGTARIQGNITQSSGGYFYNNGNNVNLRSNLAGGSGYVVDAQSFNTLFAQGIEQGIGNFSGTYAPTSTSGTPSFNALKLNFTINQTGGANGITRGLYIQPTLTSATDFRAIETSLGGAYFNTTSIAASAILQADSTIKGFLPPRMTTTQKNAITSPASGLIVYDNTLGKLCVRGASAWETITSI